MFHRPDFVFFSQAMSHEDFELAADLHHAEGACLVDTGTDFSESEVGTPPLQWAAPSYENHSYRARFVSWSRYMGHALTRARHIKSRPTLFVSTNPPMLPHLAYHWKRRSGWPYVVRVLDLYPDALFQRKLVGPGHPIARTWAHLNRLSFRHAAAVTTLGPVMAERVRQYLPPDHPVEVIPTWVDTEQFRPIPKHENWFAQRHGLADGLTVMYSGNYGATHDLDGLFAAMASLQNEPRIRFLFVGGGARRNEVAEHAKSLRNLMLLPYQARADLPYSLAAADVGIVALGGGAEGVSMPSKCPTLMASGAAILGLSHHDSDLARTIDTHACGANIDGRDPVAIRQRLLELLARPDMLHQWQAKARRGAEQAFAKNVCMPKLARLLVRAGRGPLRTDTAPHLAPSSS